MGDRVAQEDELRFALLRDIIEGLVTLLRARMQDRLDGIIGATRQEGGGSEHESDAMIHGGDSTYALPSAAGKPAPSCPYLASGNA